MDDSLKKGAEARKYAISLGSLEYSGDLAKQLLAFSDKCEKVFKALQELQQGKATSSKDYLKYFQILDEKFAWYTKAEAGLVGRDYESEYSECDPLVRYTHTGFHHATCPQLITFVSTSTPYIAVLIVFFCQAAAKGLQSGLKAKPKKKSKKDKKDKKDEEEVAEPGGLSRGEAMILQAARGRSWRMLLSKPSHVLRSKCVVSESLRATTYTSSFEF